MKKQIFVNILSHYAGRLIGVALGFFVIPFLIHKLGQNVFGLIVLTESLIAFIEAFGASVRAALSRYVTFSLAKGDVDESLAYLATGRSLLYGLSAAVLLAGTAVSLNLSRLLAIPEPLAAQSKILFFLLTLSFAVTLPNVISWAVLYAKQRFDLINAALSGSLILRAVFIFVLFSILPARFANLVTYGAISLAVTWLKNAWIHSWRRRIQPDLRISAWAWRSDRTRQILSYSASMSVIQLGHILYEMLVSVFINRVWGPGSNALFGVSRKIPNVMTRVFGDTAWTLTPSFTDLLAKGDRARTQELLFFYTKTVAALTVPLSVFLIVFAEPLVVLWVGEPFLMSARLMQFGMISLVFSLPFSVCYCVTNAAAKMKPVSLATLAAFVACGALFVALDRLTGLGLLAIPVAEAAVFVAYTVLFVPTLACRVSGISLRDYWTQALGKVLVWVALLSAAGLGILKLSGLPAAFSPALTASLAGLAVLYTAGAYFWVFDRRERAHFGELGSLFLRKKPLTETV